jgi:hypothetical protein
LGRTAGAGLLVTLSSSESESESLLSESEESLREHSDELLELLLEDPEELLELLLLLGLFAVSVHCSVATGAAPPHMISSSAISLASSVRVGEQRTFPATMGEA